MQSRFAEITEVMQKELPRWFKMRKDKSSMGAQFLNVFGLQFDDIKFMLQYALDNQFIGTADVHQIDIIYKANIPPSLTEDDTFIFIGGNTKLQTCASLKEFFEGIDTRFLERKEIYYPNPYYIDWVQHIVYFKRAYDPTESYPEGRVTLRLLDDEFKPIAEHELPQHIHHVHNFFDEFGLLLDTARLYGEKNREYKERLLDVFRHPANSTKTGLEFHLARELGLWKEVKWYDGGAELVLNQSNILPHSIEVDGIKWGEAMIKYDHSGRVVLSADEEFRNISRTVRFISGLKMHTFHDKRDYAFQRELYDIDGTPTTMLQYYVDVITNKIPILWNHFVWNESFWNVADTEMSGYGAIPTFNDARFLNWQKYKG